TTLFRSEAKIRSMEKYRVSHDATGAKKAKANNGKLVSKPDCELLRCKSELILSNSGGKPVTGPRKLNATRKINKSKNAELCCARRCSCFMISIYIKRRLQGNIVDSLLYALRYLLN